MNEEAARAWMRSHFHSEKVSAVSEFVRMVTLENAAQNLVAPSTLTSIWSRHVVDSAQLMRFGQAPKRWLDVGTGGGFPGMILALVGEFSTIMVEPRRRRADFLQRCIQAFGIEANTTVIATKIERHTSMADIISARAVGSVGNLLQATAHCATPATRWVLPRGRVNVSDFANLQESGKVFHVEQSLTDPESVILIVEAAA